MKILKIIIVFITVLISLKGEAQNTLLTEAIATRTDVFVKWYPLEASVWLEGMRKGYKIERFEINQGTSQSLILSNAVLAKDTLWFGMNKTAAGGLMEPIGALLYDTTFQFNATGDLNPDEMRYNFVVKEAEDSRAIAEAVGLSFRDSTVVSGKKYRYVVSLNSGNIAAEGQVEMAFGSETYTRSPIGLILQFKFPGGKSLSQMNPSEQVVLPAVRGIAKAYGDSIVLRWGPNSAKLWAESNELGYVISRAKGLDNPSEEIAFIKPWPYDSLEGKIEKDEMALIAAAQLHNKVKTEPLGFAEEAQAFENQWGFALFAAERSALAGDLLGLRFVDKDVEDGAVYLYEIKSLAAPNFFARAMMPVLNEYKAVPAPVGFQLKSGDRQFSLIWDKDANRKNFSAYEVEHSEDGKNWTSLREEPIVFLEDVTIPISQYAIDDSVAYNYKDYYYRLRGLTSFGDYSEYAEVKGQALDLTPPSYPLLQKVVFNDTTRQANIQWDTGSLVDDFDGFYVLYGHDSEGRFDTVSQKLPFTQNTFSFKPQNGFSGEKAHYFKVIAKDINGNIAPSLDQYMHVPDLTPPPPPALFTGVIEKDGTVNLVWEHSDTDDVAGYRLYYSNNGEDEFSPLIDDLITENKYTYQVQTDVKNRYLYFMVQGEDLRYNRGRTSPILKLKRPDKFPPIPPNFYNPVGRNGALYVQWDQSPSEDVAKYHVYKRLYGSEDEWGMIHTTSVDTTLFIDTAVVLDVIYEYKIRAEDDSENISEDSPKFTGKLRFQPEIISVDNFSALPNADNNAAIIKWDLDINPKVIPEGITWEVVIMRSAGAKNVSYLGRVPSNIQEYTDSDKLRPNVIYNYSVKVLFSDGQEGKRSLIKSVMLE